MTLEATYASMCLWLAERQKWFLQQDVELARGERWDAVYINRERRDTHLVIRMRRDAETGAQYGRMSEENRTFDETSVVCRSCRRGVGRLTSHGWEETRYCFTVERSRDT